MATDELEVKRRAAFQLFKEGQLESAIATQVTILNATQSGRDIRDLKTLSLFLFVYKDFRGCLAILNQAIAINPDHDDAEILENIAACHLKIGNYRESEEAYLKLSALSPDEFSIHGCLADVYAKLEAFDKSKHHGEQSLRLRAEAFDGNHNYDPADVPIPQFDPDSPDRNVISFSLWGRKERYLRSAVENVKAARYLYPGWVCRFYIDDSVPKGVVDDLIVAGSDIVMMDAPARLYEGLFWRFLVADDPDVDRYLVRDADSVLSIKERMAVEEWVNSAKHFHMLRDNPTHTELILAGLWGGVRGALPPMAPQIDTFIAERLPRQTIDQEFLREEVWPVFRKSCLIHDSIYEFGDAKPYPASIELPTDYHVGQNASIHPDFLPVGSLQASQQKDPLFQERKHFVYSVSAGRVGTRFWAEFFTRNLPGAEVHHERTSCTEMGTNTPDSRQSKTFNTLGNTIETKGFWRHKLTADRFGAGETYVEISHFLCKAGLIENLHFLPQDSRIDLLFLDRDTFDLTWSYANRYDFSNNGFTWLFSLDPNYPKAILPSGPYIEDGMIGRCLWYVHEMKARMAYYERLVSDQSNVHCHHLFLEPAMIESQASSLFREMFPEQKTPVSLPPRINESKSFSLGEQGKELVKDLMARFKLDPKTLGQEFYASGKRL